MLNWKIKMVSDETPIFRLVLNFVRQKKKTD